MLNESVYPLIENKKSTFDFNFQLEGCRIQDPAIPEAVVAFEETNLRALFIKHSLQVDSIHYGSWSGRTDYFEISGNKLIGVLANGNRSQGALI